MSAALVDRGTGWCECFVIRDASGQALSYVYFDDDSHLREVSKPLTSDEARRRRPTLRMDARARAEAELSEDDNVPANWTLQTEEIRLVESVGGYPNVEIRWRPATRREVRDFVSAYQRIRADEIKERVNKLYASEVNVFGHLDALKADGGGRVLSSTDKDIRTGNHIETSVSEEPSEGGRRV